MIQSEARVLTNHASRYLSQLCKHFEHRVQATYTHEHGRLELPSGLCLLDAEPDVLIMRAEAKDEESLREIENVLTVHLERFAFRDKPEIRWTRGGV
jgi:hypothetical protein